MHNWYWKYILFKCVWGFVIIHAIIITLILTSDVTLDAWYGKIIPYSMAYDASLMVDNYAMFTFGIIVNNLLKHINNCEFHVVKLEKFLYEMVPTFLSYLKAPTLTNFCCTSEIAEDTNIFFSKFSSRFGWCIYYGLQYQQ